MDKRDPGRDRVKGAFEDGQGHRTGEMRPEGRTDEIKAVELGT